MGEIMTPDEFKDKMQQIVDDCGWDCEGAHSAMDDLMCDLLRTMGYYDGVDIFNYQDKWYA